MAQHLTCFASSGLAVAASSVMWSCAVGLTADALGAELELHAASVRVKHVPHHNRCMGLPFISLSGWGPPPSFRKPCAILTAWHSTGVSRRTGSSWVNLAHGGREAAARRPAAPPPPPGASAHAPGAATHSGPAPPRRRPPRPPAHAP